MKLKIYISGAITGVPIEEARLTFEDAAKHVTGTGHVAVNPFDVPPHWRCDCPIDVTDTAGAGGSHSWACYLRGDLAALLDCDAILMLPGWESSHGARLELTTASACGLRVFWEVPV